MFTIQPVWRSRIEGSTSCARWNGANTCTSNISLQPLLGEVDHRDEVGDGGVVHEDVDRAVGGHRGLHQPLAVIDLGEVGLDEAGFAAGLALMCAMVSVSVPESRLSPSSAVRAVATTRAPSCASLAAIAAPMPRLAPVTMATLPFSGPFGLTVSVGHNADPPIEICGRTDAPNAGQARKGQASAPSRLLLDVAQPVLAEEELVADQEAGRAEHAVRRPRPRCWRSARPSPRGPGQRPSAGGRQAGGGRAPPRSPPGRPSSGRRPHGAEDRLDVGLEQPSSLGRHGAAHDLQRVDREVRVEA